MDGEQKFWLLLALMGALIVITAIISGSIYTHKEDQLRAQSMQVCLQAGKTPLECKEALK